MKRLLFLVPVVAFVAVLAAFFAGLGRDPSRLPSVYLDRPLPAFAAPPLRPGDVGLTNADLAIGEPLLLNVFASWCGPCRVEHPVFMRLRAQGVPIHGLNWKDAPDAGARWLAELGDPYIRIGADVSGRTGIELGVAGVPETFVIDKRGRVRYRHVGAVTPEVWREKIEPLMARLRTES
jgi:cytochrome c biogenesis protein CcmG, thiol:disulfide interchange protein DsbE